MEAKLAQQITFIKQFLIYSIFKDQRVLLVRQRVEQLCALTPHQERAKVAHKGLHGPLLCVRHYQPRGVERIR